MKTLLSNAKSFSNPLVIAPLLGTSLDVLIRLKTVKDEAITRLAPEVKVKQFVRQITHPPTHDFIQSEIINFYATSVLMSRTPVATHTAVCRVISFISALAHNCPPEFIQ